MQRGFTLVEILITFFIFSIIIAMPMAFFWGIGRGDALTSATQQVVAALHEAETKTISGNSLDGQEPSLWGVYFQPTYYILFAGSAYNPNDTNNEKTDLPTGITLSQVQLPSNTVVFERTTGHVVGFDAAQNFVTLTDENTQKTIRITISQVGGITYR